MRATPAETMTVIAGKTYRQLRYPKESSYDHTGIEKGQLRGQHAADGMVAIKNKLCAYSGCLKHRSYGVAGKRWSEFCAEHVVDEVVRIKEEIEEGFSKQPEFGVPGNTTTEPYSAPASIGMVGVLSKPCAGETCLKGLVFGFEGGKQAIFCAEHALDGMIDIAKSSFGREGARKRPSSWVTDAGNVQFGGGDAPGWLANVTVANWKCSREASPTAPNYSSAKYSKEEGFAEHIPGPDGGRGLPTVCPREMPEGNELRCGWQSAKSML